MDDNTSIENNLEMRPNGRNQNIAPIVVDKYFISSSYNNDDEPKEKIGIHLVENQETIK
jgi:hypothetical protein